MLIGSPGCGSGSYGDAEVVGDRPQREEPGPHADARLAGRSGRSTAASRSDAASSTAPLAVTHERCPTRRAEEAQHAERRVRLLELGEPLLPGAPRSRRAGGSAPSAGHCTSRCTPDGGLPARTSSCATSTSRRENARVDRREVRDQEAEQREPGRGLEEGQDVGGEVGRSDEPEGEQRRAAHLERPLEPAARRGRGTSR